MAIDFFSMNIGVLLPSPPQYKRQPICAHAAGDHILANERHRADHHIVIASAGRSIAVHV